MSGRSAQLDSSLASAWSTLSRSRTPEAGLLLGQAVGSRECVYAVVRTPPPDPDSPVLQLTSAASGTVAGKGKSSKGGGRGAGAAAKADLDVDWLAAHAGQVAGMLPGGIDVVGIFLLGPSAASSALSEAAIPALAALRSELRTAKDKDLLLALVPDGVPDAPPPVRLCPAGVRSPSDLRPLNAVYVSVLSQLRALRAVYDCGSAAPLAPMAPAGEGQPPAQLPLASALRAALAAELARVRATAPTLDGCAGGEGATVGSALGDRRDTGVTLWTPPPSCTAACSRGGAKDGPVAGEAWLRGSCAAVAYVHVRASLEAGLAAVMEDVASTLSARVEREASIAEDTDASVATGSGVELALSQRVGADLALSENADSALRVTDLLGEGEAAGGAEALERIALYFGDAAKVGAWDALESCGKAAAEVAGAWAPSAADVAGDRPEEGGLLRIATIATALLAILAVLLALAHLGA